MHMQRVATALLLSLMPSLSACDTQELDDRLATSQQGLYIDKSILRPAEDLPLSIAEQHPHYSGHYCKNGDLIVAVTAAADTSEIAAISSILKSRNIPFFCHNRSLAEHEPDVVAAIVPYTFLQLRSWRDSYVGDFFKGGGRGIGIDYLKNRLVLDVKIGEKDSHTDALLSHDIPSGAVEVVEREPVKLLTGCATPSEGPSLGDCYRPVPGGVKVDFRVPSTSPPVDWGACSLNSAARHVGFSQDGWVTASHCMNVDLFGVNNGYAAHQWRFYSNDLTINLIGSEAYDHRAAESCSQTG